MTRRTFTSLIPMGFFALNTVGCNFEYSPNQVDIKNENRNNKSIAKIKALNKTYPITIALISDTHNFYTKLRSTINKIRKNIDTYDFVINGGDITDAGLQQEYNNYTNIADDLDIPFIQAIGNHDAIANGVFIFRNTFGEFNFTFNVAHTYFIFFNNNTWEFGSSPLNLNWLEQELKECRNKIIQNDNAGQIIVVNHIDAQSRERYSYEEVDRYEKLMRDYEVTMSINGHQHAYNLHQKYNIDYLTVDSVRKNSFVKLTLNGPSQFDYIIDRINV